MNIKKSVLLICMLALFFGQGCISACTLHRNIHVKQALRKRLATVEYKNTRLSKVADVFERDLGVDIKIDRSAGNPEITIYLEDVTCEEALKWSLKTVALSYTIADGRVLIARPTKIGALPPERFADRWENDIRDILNKRISFEYVATPLAEVVSDLNRKYRANLVISEDLKNIEYFDVSLTLQDVRFHDAIFWIVKSIELSYRIEKGRILIGYEDELGKAHVPKHDERIDQELFEKAKKRVSISWEDKLWFSGILVYLRNAYNINIIVNIQNMPNKIKEDSQNIEIEFKNETFHEALTKLLEAIDANLTYTAINGIIYISDKNEIKPEDREPLRFIF